MWNYIFFLIIITGILSWQFFKLDGRIALVSVLIWVIIGKYTVPWIINEHIGFMYRWFIHDYEKANIRYRQAINSGKGTNNAYCTLGSLTYAEGDTVEAIKLLEKGLERVPNDISARVILARALLKVGRIDDAFLEAIHCISIANRNPLSYMIYGEVLAKKKEFLSAISAYQKSLELSSDNVEGRLKLGELFWQMGRKTQAEEEFIAAKTLSPEHPDCLYWWSEVLYEKGDREAARKTLQSALEKHPIDDNTYQIAYQQIVSKLGQMSREKCLNYNA